MFARSLAKTLPKILLLAALTSTAAHAAIILEYQTASSTSNPTLSPSVVDAAISGDALAAGSGLTAVNGSTWTWRDWGTGFGGGHSSATSFAEAVSENDFWTWGFDVTGAVEIALTTLDIRLDRSGTGPNQFEIQASVNGGAATSVLTGNFGDTSLGLDFVAVDLSGIGAVSQGDSVVFTMAAFGEDSGGASNVGTFDLETLGFGSDPRALRLNANVVPIAPALPEPSIIALLGLGLLGLARCRPLR
ncbi:MAG: PEP-CTERM sorting domain-containing protein [Gammaproteobacteria bacterium]|nr:PEP-CTERM sorting domain-containing protein [Gammaproteobacteria bacterium]